MLSRAKLIEAALGVGYLQEEARRYEQDGKLDLLETIWEVLLEAHAAACLLDVLRTYHLNESGEESPFAKAIDRILDRNFDILPALRPGEGLSDRVPTKPL